MSRPTFHLKLPVADSSEPRDLTERQAMVLRALVSAYVGQAGPVSSGRLALLMCEPLSPASIRNTLAELDRAGLIEKAHASSGRVPTSRGMSVYIRDLLDFDDLGPYEQRMLERAMKDVEESQTARQASHLLSEYTRQLGFVMTPRVEHLRLQAVHLVSVADRRVLAILVTETGSVLQRVFDTPERLDARALEHVGTLLGERVSGQTLAGLRRNLEEERDRLRGEADAWVKRVWWAGLAACDQFVEDDLVIATRVTLLDQPEFSDPERIRGLFTALETNQRLLDLLRELGSADQESERLSNPVGLAVSLGHELGEPSLKDCALVAVSYGQVRPRPAGETSGPSPDLPNAEWDRLAQRQKGGPTHAANEGLGVLGVIGPQRMDYARVIPMVSYCADLVTRKLIA